MNPEFDDEHQSEEAFAAPDEAVDEVQDDIAAEFDDQGHDQIPDEPAEVEYAQVTSSAVAPPETGDPRVDEVLRGLAAVDSLPTADHVGVYDEVHRGLQDALANLDQG